MAQTYYSPVPVDHTKVPSTLTNFPVLIGYTDARLKTTGNSGHVASANGYDIRPYSDTALTSALTYELVSYNASTGQVEMYVLISSLSSASDTNIYLGYGDTTLTTDGSSNTTWNSNFKAVYHFGTDTTLGLADSTSNGNTLTNVNTATHGAGAVVGGSASLAGASTQYFTTAAAPVAVLPATITVLFNVTTATQNSPLVQISQTAANVIAYQLGIRTTLVLRTTQNTGTATDTATFTTGSWNYGASRFVTTTDRNVKLNNNTNVQNTASAADVVPVKMSIGVFNTNTVTFPFDGKIDEVRVSNVDRGADWVTAEYNNLINPTTFAVMGTEVAVSSGIAFDAASNSTYQAASSSYSWSHTCTGANRYLVVGVGMLSVAQSVSSITYNSVALTLLGVQSSLTGAARVELWGLVAPATGSNTIAVTLTGAIASAGAAASYTGVHQSFSTEGFNSAQATNVGAADATVNVTTVADNDWVVDIVATDDTAITVGAGQTSRNNVTGAGGSAADSDEGPKTPAGSVTMSWTNIAALATWSIGAIALRPIAASGLSSARINNSLMMMGIGT